MKFSVTEIHVQYFSFNKIRLKMSSAQCWWINQKGTFWSKNILFLLPWDYPDLQIQPRWYEDLDLPDWRALCAGFALSSHHEWRSCEQNSWEKKKIIKSPHSCRCTPWSPNFYSRYIDGLVQEKCNSSVLAIELRLSCTNPPISEIQKNWRIFF